MGITRCTSLEPLNNTNIPYYKHTPSQTYLS
nr:MAG TPA: hypothetical protein [Caudoviricetes sp.]